VAVKHVSYNTSTLSFEFNANANIIQIDLESTDEDLQEVQAEISLLSTCASPFVTQYRASFLRGYKLWIVMEYLGGGSCQDLVHYSATPTSRMLL
jgi:serine/threonine protein kinase